MSDPASNGSSDEPSSVLLSGERGGGGEGLLVGIACRRKGLEERARSLSDVEE